MRSSTLLLVLLAAACNAPSAPSSNSEPAAKPAAAPTPAPAATPAPVALPAVAEAGGLSFRHTPPLVRRQPKSGMRAAEYGLEGNAESELSVFYFGPGQGGSVEMNLQRWLGQLKQADGSDTAQKALRSTRKVGEIEVSLIEATGSYGGGMSMPGAPPPPQWPDAMMLGAIANGPNGPVFFKLVGPRAAVEGARSAFDALIGSLSAGAPR